MFFVNMCFPEGLTSPTPILKIPNGFPHFHIEINAKVPDASDIVPDLF